MRKRMMAAFLIIIFTLLSLLADNALVSAAVPPRAGATELGSSPDAVAEFHVAMTGLWTDHVLYIRLMVVASHHKDEKAQMAAMQGLQNNALAFGQAFSTMYGEAAGQRLTTLLMGYNTAFNQYLQATLLRKAGLGETSYTAVLRQKDELVAFFAQLNPAFPAGTLNELLTAKAFATRTYIDARLKEDFATDDRRFAETVRLGNNVADIIARGIIEQFPQMFGAKTPSIAIVAPAGGQIIRSQQIEVRVMVTNFVLDAANIGKANIPGHGHWHIYLDGRMLGETAEESFIIRNIPPGRHTIRAVLHNNDHTPVLPIIDATVYIAVDPRPAGF